MASLADVRGIRPGVPFRRGVSYAGEYEVPFDVFDGCVLDRWPHADIYVTSSGEYSFFHDNRGYH